MIKAHKVMTPEEYAAMPIEGWHRVYRNVDGFGAVGVSFGAQDIDRNEIIEECAVAAEAQDRIGREWVDNSLWANICKRAGANVRKLKSAANITFTPESTE